MLLHVLFIFIRERLKPKEEDDEDQGIPVIPELEEQRSDNIGDKIAVAPR